MRGRWIALVAGVVVGIGATTAWMARAAKSGARVSAKRTFSANPSGSHPELVTATGSWWSPDVSPDQWPTGAVSIFCLKSAGICVTTRSMRWPNDERLDTDIFVQDVRSWTETQIVIAASETSCATTLKTIDLVAQRVLMRLRTKRSDCKSGDPYLEDYSLELGEVLPTNRQQR